MNIYAINFQCGLSNYPITTPDCLVQAKTFEQAHQKALGIMKKFKISYKGTEISTVSITDMGIFNTDI